MLNAFRYLHNDDNGKNELSLQQWNVTVQRTEYDILRGKLICKNRAMYKNMNKSEKLGDNFCPLQKTYTPTVIKTT